MKSLSKAVIAVALSATAPSAHAAVTFYDAVLSGINESPPNASPGTGYAVAAYDNIAHSLLIEISFSGLLGTTTASHIHATTAVAGTGTAGVATTTPYFTGFPIGVTSGVYDHTFDLTLATSYNPSFVSANGGTGGAETALTQAMANGKAYLNVHSSFAPGGEIRGFFAPGGAPEASTWMMLVLGFGMTGAAIRGARRQSVIA